MSLSSLVILYTTSFMGGVHEQTKAKLHVRLIYITNLQHDPCCPPLQ